MTTGLCSIEALSPLEKFNHVVGSVSIDFSTGLKWDAPSHHTVSCFWLHANKTLESSRNLILMDFGAFFQLAFTLRKAK